jgi:hypothetical protein
MKFRKRFHTNSRLRLKGGLSMANKKQDGFSQEAETAPNDPNKQGKSAAKKKSK